MDAATTAAFAAINKTLTAMQQQHAADITQLVNVIQGGQANQYGLVGTRDLAKSLARVEARLNLLSAPDVIADTI